jgi:vacuolar-type H+-ATPase subunit H
VSKSEHDQSQSQEIITSLAQRELELQQLVDRATAEAASIVEAARRKALAIEKAAADRLGNERAGHQARLAALAVEARAQTLARATDEAAKLEARAEAKRSAALEQITAAVLPEAAE